MSAVFFAALLSAALAGAWLDFRYRRLPNWLSAATFVAGVAASFALHGPDWAFSGLLHALVALAAGAALFAMGMIGGGDAKFYAAIAAWLPLRYGMPLLLLVSMAGLLALVVWFPMRRRIAATMGGGPQAAEFRKVPYGIAIATGGVLAFLMVGT